MNILLIIVNKNIENMSIFKDRVGSLGDTFFFFDNLILVETESSTKEAYEKLSANGFEQTSMLIVYLKNELLGFWGRMSTELWDWLANKESTTNDGLSESYIRTIKEKDSVIDKFTEENKRLANELKDKDRIIANLQQQVDTFCQLKEEDTCS